MLEAARSSFHALLLRRSWPQQLAGILPLSALVDFLDVPRLIHIFELTGRMPLWNWTVTPSGSRILLSERRTAEDPCRLDRIASSTSKPICLDGRYGDRYPMASDETVRMCVRSVARCEVENRHANVEVEAGKRPQRLEVIHVERKDGTGPEHVDSAVTR